jgi:hypothetical protein
MQCLVSNYLLQAARGFEAVQDELADFFVRVQVSDATNV